MGVDRRGLLELGAPHLIYLEHLASRSIFSEPYSMGGVDQAKWGCSIRDASMEYGGVDKMVCSQLILPSPTNPNNAIR